MTALTERVGPYLHAAGMRRDITFPAGRSVRTFTVVMAGAYDAGIVGSECNGLAVLDADNAQVVLDEHMRAGSGYNGPSRAQVAEFERVCAITDWKAFAEFVRSNPRHRRNSVPDLDQPQPDAPDETALVFKAARMGKVPGLPGPSIMPQAVTDADADPTVPYEFPLRTRYDIAAWLAAHAMHGDRGGQSHLAWDIKVYSADMSGRTDGYAPNEGFDALWEAYARKNAESLHHTACEDGLRQYVDGEVDTYFGDSEGAFKFSTGGRSGGWLELTEFQGRPLGFRSMTDAIQTFLDMDDADLARLYVGVRTFDKDIRPASEYAHQIAFQRSVKEDEWASQDVAEEEAMELGLEGWTHPGTAPAPAP